MTDDDIAAALAPIGEEIADAANRRVDGLIDELRAMKANLTDADLDDDARLAELARLRAWGDVPVIVPAEPVLGNVRPDNVDAIADHFRRQAAFNAATFERELRASIRAAATPPNEIH